MSPGGLNHIDSEGTPIPPTRISPAIRWRRRRRPVKRDGNRRSPSDLISAIPFDGAFSFLFISDNNNSPQCYLLLLSQNERREISIFCYNGCSDVKESPPFHVPPPSLSSVFANLCSIRPPLRPHPSYSLSVTTLQFKVATYSEGFVILPSMLLGHGSMASAVLLNRQMVSLFQSCHKNWFSWEWTVSNSNLNSQHPLLVYQTE